ncbi:MAG: hypothetical protein KY462_09745 [Actinobacteria bacterium]|nr:hypothetical protein [Actinomycetota bacterium]
MNFARAGSRFTRDFECLVAWLATKMDKDAVRRLVRIDWNTVGRICDRVVADELDPGRLDGLFHMGVDEVSWKRHHNYMTLVVNHDTNKVVWGAEGVTPRPSTVSSMSSEPPVAPRSRRCRWIWVRRSENL